MLTITDLAKEKLAGFAAQADDADVLVLRVAIVGRGANGFQYDLQLVSKSDTPEMMSHAKSMMWWSPLQPRVLSTWMVPHSISRRV